MINRNVVKVFGIWIYNTKIIVTYKKTIELEIK